MSRAKINFTMITIIIGFMIAIQFKTVQQPVARDTRDTWELRDSIRTEMNLQKRLLAEIRLQDERLNKYSSEMEGSKESVLRQTLLELRKEAGLTEETGPGIKLTVRPINQALIPGDSPQTVSPITLKRLINELNMYGAKHISIDGERLVNTTVIRDINGETKVGTHSLRSYPFSINVITETYELAEKMFNRMHVSPSIDDFFLDNLEVVISNPNKKIVIPAHVEPITIRNMEPVDEEGE
ncbi:DUF881 domain-containing protein [Lederbergia graminis]|uniref:DUF881 domain-containing protein n=1 Tax=Lederbergia graminis TaxID=735518 RepID=A0ABW0LGD0_9BACI|nr:DUF881 domain-containing protein [Paenibacillus bovis]